MKKFLSMILASVMVLTLLAGCGGGNSNQPAAGDQPQQTDNQAPDNNTDAPAEPAGEDVTIQVAALASGYEEAYPGMWRRSATPSPPRPASRWSLSATRCWKT